VSLVARCSAGTIDLEVTDTGTGIDPALREHVLEPFVHGDSPAAGSGMGLAIVSRLVHVMQGALAIDSAAAGGTRVAVRLPRA
jgi:osomolarity two-component system sensor histidine kinase SLN1